MMRTLNAFLLGCVLMASSFQQTAQSQSLLDGIEVAPLVITPVAATFKDTRIINAQSNETPGHKVLHFVIAHRFGQINEGAYALWGLDNASMRMAFDYGVTDRLAVGVARSTFQKTYEANIGQQPELEYDTSFFARFPLL